MGLRINQNIAAMNSYRNLSVTEGQMSKSLEKLSSGFRINRAADDAAGLAISEGLRAQIGGLKVAVRNTQDAVSVVQTAEGALTETHAILQRMRDLSVQASSDGGLNTQAKESIQKEMTELTSELTRIADTTQFNGTKLLDGNFSKSFQVGANADEVIDVNIGGGTALDAAGLGVNTLDVTTAAADDYVVGLEVGDTFDQTTVTAAATWTSTAFADEATALAALDGETIDGVTISLTTEAAVADVNAQLAAGGSDVTLAYNASDQIVATGATGVGADTSITVSGGLTGTGVAATSTTASATATAADVVTNDAKASGATQAVKALDEAIKDVSTTRAELGAKQNRFEHTINNLNVAVENLSASESRIRDTDMAQEMVNFTRAQILSQAGTAMLAQANQAPQGVLRLLQ